MNPQPASTPADLAAQLGHVPTAPEWPTDTSRTPIPLELFGWDHWSTFAYVETRTVDQRGLLAHDRMRCHANRHPIMAGAKQLTWGALGDASDYQTRIKATAVLGQYPNGTYGTTEVPDHDDYDCLDDLIAAGLLKPIMPVEDPTHGWFVDAYGRPVLHPGGGGPVPSGFVTGLTEKVLAAHAQWTLTAEGQRVAAELRAHKAGGGTWHTFAPRTSAGASHA